MLKIIIAGGRDFNDKQLLEKAMMMWCYKDPMYMPHEPIEIVSGCAKGADALGSEWAITNWTGLQEFPADWRKHGRSAGPIRNNEMAEYADVLVAFWDGKSKGTKHMIQTALTKGLEVHVYRY